jgi:tetratricopeptide (TPR) repeat protein
MKDGKYQTALDQYEAAQEVAPNNAMIMVGRANAELGAGYYKKAETHLRIAMQSDPVVTMAQFDLRTMLGEQRLTTIVRDLKDTATAQKTDPGLVLLLAYLAYNSGSEAQAATYLNEADRRAAGKDELVTLLRNHWKLPEGGNK